MPRLRADFLAGVILAGALAGALLPAGEEATPPAPPPTPPKPEAPPQTPKPATDLNERVEQAKRLKEVAAKRRAEAGGEERPGRPVKRPAEGDRPEHDVPPPAPPRPPLEALAGMPAIQALVGELNVLDRAKLDAALSQYQSGKREDAVAAAEKVAAKSPDPEAAGVARLALGRMQLESGQGEAAAKTLRSVAGRAAALAFAALIEPLVKAGHADGIVAAYKDLLASQTTALDRCRVLKTLLEILDRLGPEELSPEARVKVLTAVAESLPYEEALNVREALAKERSIWSIYADHRRVAGAPPELEGFPEFAQKMRDLNTLPPEQRREAIQEFKASIEKKIDALAEEGKGEQAARLKELADRMEGRGKLIKGKAPKKPGKGDPEKLKEEIKRLEDDGRLEEANKLKKELEMIERPAGDMNEKF